MARRPPALWKRLTLSAALMAIPGTALLLGYAEATGTPVVARYEVEALPADARPVTIALVSDTHMMAHRGFGMALDDAALRAVVTQINALRADMVVLAGDYTGEGASVREAVTPFATLRAPLGVYAVIGNHDYDRGDETETIRSEIARTGVKPLVNAHIDAGPVVIVGLDDLWNGASDIGEANRALSDAGGKPVVLVSHNPDVFPQVPGAIPLTLAGHTHGGHVLLPLVGAPVSSSRFGQRYRRGLITEAGHRMVVTSGVGGMAFRWGVPPEIALVTLTPRTATAVRR